MKRPEIIAELDLRIARATEEADEAHRFAMHSYGAGYNRGYLNALREIRGLIAGGEIVL
jgi:hypothetical protein